MALPDVTRVPLAEPRREVVTVQRAMKLVRVSRRCVYYWMESGKIDWVLTAGGHRRIFVDTLWRTPRGQRIDARAITVNR